ncbi:formylglycine-generating enzyme family protein [Rhizobium azibense]|uniref:Formylglycine-generating enzyme required for sulfatase activity n=1 Tax=Rhizobium azibense TaxID=1136135 RepID=A0A4R3R7V8_9HYPH|nr:formylglycine-generating enzyme family protein [Rhizobium azibense]TCU31353.1 formylglycine-generating enzyme required for sulfatase activity [Rhizobium azibense]
MAFPATTPTYLTLILIAFPAAATAGSDRVTIEGFAIDRSEVTIADFAAFADATKLRTAAERDGGGHEWGSGWERRPGWSYRSPFGEPPQDVAEPAVHVSWYEARDYCASVGGRLPTRAEWQRAAYREYGNGSRAGFVVGKTYSYPTGDTPEGANTNAGDPWPRHVSAATTRQGVNGLYDMGGNVWEWLADRDGDTALTAGGSWWYGPDKMRKDAMQWKPADFYVVYIGFRCAYDLKS